MTIQFNSSSEMMSQYLQGETIGPGHRFQAIQTREGYSLLFSIGTDQNFYLHQESEDAPTGWLLHDLSADLAQIVGAVGTAKDFFVAQDPNSAAFCLLVALTYNGVDTLYFANAYTYDADTQALSFHWSILPFDAANPPESLSIHQVYSAVADATPAGVVDVVSAQDGNLDRYYIDPTQAISSQVWTPYNLPLDMSTEEAVKLCSGRRKGAKVNGLYTLGTVGGAAAVVFQEYFDYYGSGAAPVSRLDLPAGIAPQALAAAPSAQTAPDKDGGFTDLYVTGSDGGLYFFEASSQSDQAQGQLLFANGLFEDVNALYAYQLEGKVVVWGLNRAQQVFYTQAPNNQLTDPTAWSVPLAIGSQVEQISPYINRINGGNTYFAHTGSGQLKKIFQDPMSTLWTRQSIVVPALPDSAAQKFDAYTTQITLTDANNLPITDVSIWVSSSQRMPVYINYHYYVLDATPIAIPVNDQGKLYLLQRTEELLGTRLTIQDESRQHQWTINPMEKAAEQLLALNTPDALRAATVTDDKGNNPQPLIPADASDADVQAAADALQSLAQAYTDVGGGQAPSGNTVTTFAVRQTPNLQLSVGSAVDAVVVAAGDLVSFLKDATSYVIHIVEDAAQGVWNFVCEIGEAVLTFVIETIEQVIAAIQAVLQALKAAVKLLVQFVKFLFSWDDISLTKDVLKQLLVLSVQEGLDSIDDLKVAIHQGIGDAETAINNWADIGQLDEGPTTNTLAQQSDDSSTETAPNDYLQYYLTNNLNGASTTDNSTATEEDVTMVQTLLAGLAAEEAVVEEACQVFYDEILAEDQYKTMSIMELLQKSVAIIADALLSTADVVCNTLLTLVQEIGADALALLDTPIYIPVLSDILEEFFDVEIGFSVLDVLLYVVAVPATLAYKILAGEAPFSEDDPATQAILAAQDWQTAWDSIQNIAEGDQVHMQQTLFKIARLGAGILDGVNALLVIPLALPGVKRVFTTIKTLAGLLGAVMNVLVTKFANPAPLKNEAMKTLHKVIKDLLKLQKLVFFGLTFYTKKKDKAMEMGVKTIGTVIGLVLKGVDLITVADHAYEVIRDYDDYPIQADLVLAQSAVSFAGFGNGVTELAMKLTPDASVVASSVEVGIDIALYLLKGLLEVGETVVVEIAD